MQTVRLTCLFLSVFTHVSSSGVFQRCPLLPPPQNEIRPLLQHASGETHVRKFACAAANLRYFQGICKLPRLEISVAFRIVIQVFAFHLTSCGKFVSWSFAVCTGTHFSHKNASQVRCIWKHRSCLSYLNDNSREIIVKLIQYKYVLSRLWSLEAWNIDRLASGRCFWLFLQHASCLYACAGIYGLCTALCLWNCETWEMHRLMWYSFQGD